MGDRTKTLLFACLATLTSGVACMFYQLAWVRKLTGVTTAATVAQVLVLAAFMAGLGFGAWLGGKLLRRITRPLVAYAAIELGGASLFVLGIPILSSSVHVQAALLDLGASPGVALGAQLGVVGLYLVAATTLLGMTLPMLIAGLEGLPATQALVKQEAAYNLIYGINTAGALAGCVICGYASIELVGLNRSILLGAACSVASALGALSIGAARTARSAPEVGEDAPVPRRVLMVVFATGAIALAAEVVWIRIFSLVILNTVYAFTQVIAAVLLGIALAGIATGWIGRRLLRRDGSGPRLTKVTFCALIAAAVWMSLVPWLTHALAGTPDFAGLAASGGSITVTLLLAAILVPSSGLLALVLPLLIAATEARNTTQVLARLFAVNTLGAVLGTLAMGLWLLPWLGLGGAQLLLACAVVVVAWSLPGRVFGRTRWLALAGALAVVLGMHTVIELPGDLYALRFERDEKILDLREGVTSDVLVSDDPAGHRRIWINSAWVAGTGGGHALLGHLPALSVNRIDHALGIALGTGQTFGAILQHGATRLDCVEINPDVVALSQRWFGAWNHGLFDHPGVRVFLEDGRAFLRATRERYDLIVLEPLQAWSAGTTSLYTREFYEEARGVLRDGGVLAQWIPFYGQDTAATKAMVRTAIEVFPQASLWLDESDGILLLSRGTFELPWPRIQAELGSAQLAPLLEQKHLDAQGDLLSLFLMGPKGLASWTRDADLLEDDRPFLEYAAARHLGTTSFPATVASTLDHLEDPADYLSGAAFDTRSAVLARRATLARPRCAPELLAICVAEVELDLQRGARSERLRYQYRQLVLAWANTAKSSRDGREAILLRGIAHQADFGEAMVNLAVSYAARGRREDARTYATRALQIPRTRDGAARLLEKLGAR